MKILLVVVYSIDRPVGSESNLMCLKKKIWGTDTCKYKRTTCHYLIN